MMLLDIQMLKHVDDVIQMTFKHAITSSNDYCNLAHWITSSGAFPMHPYKNAIIVEYIAGLIKC